MLESTSTSAHVTQHHPQKPLSAIKANSNTLQKPFQSKFQSNSPKNFLFKTFAAPATLPSLASKAFPMKLNPEIIQKPPTRMQLLKTSPLPFPTFFQFPELVLLIATAANLNLSRSLNLNTNPICLQLEFP